MAVNAAATDRSQYEWTVGDRMRKARESTGHTVKDFAPIVGIARNSATNYEKGATSPRLVVIKQWALATGVTESWLLTGSWDDESPQEPERARRYSKPQPSDPKSDAPIFFLACAS